MQTEGLQLLLREAAMDTYFPLLKTLYVWKIHVQLLVLECLKQYL
jgi:hypothetical protein